MNILCEILFILFYNILCCELLKCVLGIFQYGGLSPLHYACLLPGEDGVRIVEYLLNALACPDARAEPDESYLNHYLVVTLLKLYCTNLYDLHKQWQLLIGAIVQVLLFLELKVVQHEDELLSTL